MPKPATSARPRPATADAVAPALDLAACTRLARRFSLTLVGVVLAVLALATVWRDWQVVVRSAYDAPYLWPVYSGLPVPGTALTPNSPGTTGADFAQVYTAALALDHGESAYRPTTPAYADHWRRPPAYPPLTNWLYVPLSRQPFYVALVVHELGTIFLLLGGAALVLWGAGLARHIWHVVLAMAGLLFLTPIGVTHIERGQFDILVAAALMFAVSMAYLPRFPAVLGVAAGLLGALKWTSLPGLGGFTGMAFLCGPRARRWTYVVVPVVLAVATFSFWSGVQEYRQVVFGYEVNRAPEGVTLRYFLPLLPAKGLAPAVVALLLLLLYVAGPSAASRGRLFAALSLPYALLLTTLSVVFGTISYEYRAVTLLGMMPPLVMWLVQETQAGTRVKAVTAGVFAVFLIIAFRLVCPLTLVNAQAMTAVYAGAALAFFGICLYLLATHPESRFQRYRR